MYVYIDLDRTIPSPIYYYSYNILGVYTALL